MWKDPIVAEVRRARLEIEKKCEENFARIYTRAVEVQKKAAAKLVSPLLIESKKIGLQSSYENPGCKASF